MPHNDDRLSCFYYVCRKNVKVKFLKDWYNMKKGEIGIASESQAKTLIEQGICEGCQ